MNWNASRKAARTTGAEPRPKKSKIELLLADENDENQENDFPAEVVNRAQKSLSKSEKKPEVLDAFSVSVLKIVKDEEKKRIIELHVVANSLMNPIDNQVAGILIKLQSLFFHHLPKMPRDYVSKMVFDPKQKNLALIKLKQTVGGICFRSFPSQGFTEIVFCAVSISEQTRGYGTHLMNHLKDYVVPRGIKNLLTFADLNAIGFFKKQGFTQEIRLARPVYEGYIQEYNGAILMHCELHPSIVYTEFTSIVQQQSKILKEIIQEKQTGSQETRRGLVCFKEGLRAIPVEAIPGLREAGWKPKINTNTNRKASNNNGNNIDELVDPSKLLTVLTCVLQAVRRHPLALAFINPVNERDAPNYNKVVKYPMDLSTVGQRLSRGYYKTLRLFMADMARIFSNCRLYNGADTENYCQANVLERFYQIQMRQLGLWHKKIIDDE
ncbi:hypothetical protein ACLKA6_009144 [Drosophila palustris]